MNFLSLPFLREEIFQPNVICLKHGEISIEDSGSLNGTFVNGELIHSVKPLSDRDQIRIGECIIRLEFVDESEQSIRGTGDSQIKTFDSSKYIEDEFTTADSEAHTQNISREKIKKLSNS